MRPKFTVLVPVLALSLVACSDDSGPAGDVPAPVLVANQELAAARAYGQGELRLVAVSEAGQEADLTGDGDLEDHVLALLDHRLGLIPTGLAMLPDFRRDEVPPIEVSAGPVAGVFVVDEARTGSDANGNGVPDEVRSWLFDRRTGDLVALPFLHRTVRFGGELAALLGVGEGGEDFLVYDARDQSTTSLRVPAASLVLVADDRVVLLRSELLEGIDVNLDGDQADPWVLQLYDAHTRTLVPPRWAVLGVHAVGGFLGLAVSESAQGGEDLDGDGAADGVVFVVLEPATGRAYVPVGSDVVLDYVQPDPERFVVLASERHGDRNADGDESDLVVVLHDPLTNRTLDTGLTTRWPVVPAGRWVGIQVAEAQQGELDLDGDGAALSDVLHVVDTATGRTVNLGFQGYAIVGPEGHLLVLRDEGTADWNGDGDRGDFVLFDRDLAAGRTRNTRLISAGTIGSSATSALMVVPEEMAGADLNGDGDATDPVLALYDARRGTSHGLGIAYGRDAFLGQGGFGAVLVPEGAQGRDLNGDGDLLDEVLHSLELFR